jgi:diguanylate cyclase (GGDEF)-like protein
MLKMTLHVALFLYFPVPVYLAGVIAYGKADIASVAGICILALLAIVLVAAFSELNKARQQRWDAFSPWFTFFQAISALALVTLLNAAASGHPSAFRIILILPAFAAAIIGDAKMITAVGVLTMCSIGVVTQTAFHTVGATAWTLAIWGVALGGLLFSIDTTVSRMIERSNIGEALRNLSRFETTHLEWPGAIRTVLPAVSSALECAEIEVVSCTVDTSTAKPVAVHVAGWPSDGITVPASDVDLCSVLAAGEPRVSGDLLIVPVLAPVEPHVVLVVRDSANVASLLFGEELGTAQTVASLIAGIADRAHLVAALESEVRTDPLTGVGNRRELDEILRREMAHHRRSGEPLSVAMIDLDDFKRFNDRFGHPAGDTVLKEAAQRMVSRVREADRVTRYGGEEFVIVFPGTDSGGAVEAVEAVRKLGPVGEPDGPVTFSAGVAQWDSSERGENLIDRADHALYEAKRAGKNRVVVA